MNNEVITLDVRDDIRAGRQPFARIMGVASQVAAGQEFLLIAPFEPVPLFGVLAKQGFDHEAKRTKEGDWEVRFRKSGMPGAPGVDSEASPDKACGCQAANPSAVIELDARGLEPPEPLVRILEALNSLPDGAELRAQTDRRPIHLLDQLEDRGYSALTEETQHGSFITRIKRL